MFPWKARKRYEKTKDSKEFFRHNFFAEILPGNTNFPKIRALMKEAELFGNPLAQKRCGLFDER